MNVPVTEYLRINLDAERWECRRCGHDLISARNNYKEGLLVYERDPGEIHKPVIDPSRYEYTFSPDSKFCTIYEFYCPSCGTLIETEYQAPGHRPVHDIEVDIDALKAQWAKRDPLPEEADVHQDDSLAGGRINGCDHGH